MNKMDKVKFFVNNISGPCENIATLKLLSAKTGIQAGWFGLAGFVFLVGFVFSGIGAGILTNLVGVIYPAYQSFKAIESDS